jgi:uncharacterized protein (DUF983 family)
MSDARPDGGSAPAAVAPVQVALRGLCPRCGAPTLFAGWARFADSCKACGLDFSAFNVGDGPAAFLTLILGAIIVAAAIALELTVAPPIWVHMLIWIPVTAIAVVGALRISKAALLALEYRNKAREFRSEGPR